MPSRLAEDLPENFGRAVGDCGLPREIGRRRDENGYVHHPGQAVHPARQRRSRGQGVEGGYAGKAFRVLGGSKPRAAWRTWARATARCIAL